MRFTLTYRGPLPANGDARIKQAVRRQLHPQLKQLFTYSENGPQGVRDMLQQARENLVNGNAWWKPFGGPFWP